MSNPILSVRELQGKDIQFITNYWLESKPAFLQGMGVDLEKLPSRAGLSNMLQEQLRQPLTEKQSYCIIWEVDQQAVGHCNVNDITFGEKAFMHLHMWNTGTRKKGFGAQLIRLTLPYFFANLQLKKIYSEPYALNPAPNKTLEKVGFTFLKRYVTIPGSLSFEQEVNRWKMSVDSWKELNY